MVLELTRKAKTLDGGVEVVCEDGTEGHDRGSLYGLSEVGPAERCESKQDYDGLVRIHRCRRMVGLVLEVVCVRWGCLLVEIGEAVAVSRGGSSSADSVRVECESASRRHCCGRRQTGLARIPSWY